MVVVLRGKIVLKVMCLEAGVFGVSLELRTRKNDGIVADWSAKPVLK